MKENETKIEEVVNENIYNQPELYKTIKTIPGHHRYYNCIEKIENLSLMTLNKEKLTKPTNQPTQQTQNQQPNQPNQPKYIRTYRQPIGNQTLESRIELLKIKKPNSVNETIETYQSYIDEALHKLREVNIVNYHVCIQNVMYSEMDHCPIIANFDYSFKLDDMYSSLEPQSQPQTLLETIFKNPVPKTANVEAKLIHEIIKTPNWQKKEVNVSELQKIALKHFQEDPNYELLEPSTKTDVWVKKIKAFYKKKGKTVVEDIITQEP